MKRVAFLVAVALFILALAAGFHLATSYDQYSRYNLQWNGTSSFFTLLEEKGAHEIDDPADLAGYDDAELLIIAPSGSPSSAQVAAWHTFLAHNNTIILCDDFGDGDAVLQALGTSVRISSHPVVSVDRDYTTPAAVTAYPAETNSSLLHNVSAVLLDKPTALEGGDALLQTSLLSWVDTDGNTTLDGNEEIGRSTVCTHEDLGGGEVVVVGDPDIFLNSMVDIGKDNRQFIENLLSYRPVILVDQGCSRTASAGPVIGAVGWVKGHPLLQIGIAALFIIFAAYYFRRWTGK